MYFPPATRPRRATMPRITRSPSRIHNGIRKIQMSAVTAGSARRRWVRGGESDAALADGDEAVGRERGHGVGVELREGARPFCNESERRRAPLAERSFEPRLLAPRLVAPAARRARRCKRAALAARDAREADHRAEIHE